MKSRYRYNGNMIARSIPLLNVTHRYIPLLHHSQTLITVTLTLPTETHRLPLFPSCSYKPNKKKQEINPHSAFLVPLRDNPMILAIIMRPYLKVT